MATVIALLMVVCAAAVVAQSDDVSAATPTEPDFADAVEYDVGSYQELAALAPEGTATTPYLSNGVFTLTGDMVLNLTGDVTATDLRFDLAGYNLKITGSGTLSVTYTFEGTAESADAEKAVFYGGSEKGMIVVDGENAAIDATMAVSTTATNGNLHILFNIDAMFIENGATVTMNQAATVNGVSWYCDESANYYLVMNAGTLNLYAAGFPNVILDVSNNSTINVKNPQASEFVIIDGSSISNSKIDVKPANTGVGQVSSNASIWMTGTLTMTNSSISIDGRDINFQNGATVNMDDTSSLTAPNFDMASSTGNVTINGGTINATIKDALAGSATYTLDGVTLSNVTAEDTAKIVLTGSGIVTDGSVDISVATITNDDSAPIVVSTGSAKLPDGTTGVYIKSGASAVTVDGDEETAVESEDSITVTTPEALADVAKLDNVVITANLTGSPTATLSENIVVGNGTTINFNQTVVSLNGHTITSDGSSASVNGLKVDYTVNGARSFFVLTLNGTFAIAPGSVDVTGTYSGVNEIVVREGELVLSGNLVGDMDVVISDVEIQSPALNTTVTFEDFTVNSGATLTLVNNTNVAYEVDGNFYLYGTIMPSDGTVTMTVNDNARFQAFNGSQLNGNVMVQRAAGADNAVIDLSQAQSTIEIGYDLVTSTPFGQLQNVVIVGSLNIMNNSTVTVYGSFQVNEGVTMTIQSGSTLKIDSSVASMIVDGTIMVEEGAHLIVDDAEAVEVSGSIISYGEVRINSTVDVMSGGSIRINDAEGSIIAVTEGLTVENGGELYIAGQMIIYADDGYAITNNGTVTLNNAVLAHNSTIALAGDGAVVNIQSVTGIENVNNQTYALYITDDGLLFPDHREADPSYVTIDEANVVSFTCGSLEGVRGLTVTESVTGNSRDGYENNMDIAGSVGAVNNNVGTVTPAAKISVDGPRVAVGNEMTLGTGITLDIEGTLTVSGTVYAVADRSGITFGTNNVGAIVVTGLVQKSTSVLSPTSCISAAMYQQDVNGEPNYYYTNFVDAIASGATTVYIYGHVDVMENVSVPTGITVNNQGTLHIGDTTDEGRDVVVTVADGSYIRGGSVIVDGTLTFDNKRNNSTQVFSDVAIIGDVSSTYTNIYTALSNAESGDVVTVTRDDGNGTGTVVVTNNLTIPAGVTLSVPQGKYLQVAVGVTLTVDGTLQTSHAVAPVAQVNDVWTDDETTAFGTQASARADEDGVMYACIVVNGTFMTMDETNYSYDYYQIPGAYYNLVDSRGNYNYVTPFEAAAAVAAQVTDGITVHGEVVSGDATVTGTSADDPITITVANDADFTISSMTLANAELNVTYTDATNYGLITGTIVAGDASIEAVNLMNVNLSSVDGLVISAAIVTYEDLEDSDNDVDASLNIASGTVYLANTAAGVNTIVGNVTVDEGATLALSRGATAAIYGTVTVNGTLSVETGRTLNVNSAVVSGTVTVAEATDSASAGSLVIADIMLVGLDAEFATTSTNAVVTGDVAVPLIYAVTGSTIDEQIVGEMKTTSYDVEGAIWITAYATGNIPIDNTVLHSAVPVEDAYFQYWVDEDGTQVTGNIGDLATVYAQINYNVYHIIVLANQAVDDVYVDGNIMQYGMVIPSGAQGGQAYYAYQITVAAGSHTISYTLANGYSGEGVLEALTSNTTVSGVTFTASETPTSPSGITIQLQLTGFEKSGYVPDSPDTPSTPTDSGDDGMTITDYLLIILVVLIIVMAIIVALRLMRS